MKTIFTSNYAKSGKHELSFSISVKAPFWYKGKNLLQLAPTWELVNAYKNNEITQQEYTTVYLHILKKRNLTPKKIVDMIPDNAILLCYEKPTDFCHRFVLSKWIEDKTGLVIPEFFTEKQQKSTTTYKDLLKF